MVSPVIGQAGCPGGEPDCLNPAGTWVGVSARMYNDPNSLGDRANESKGRHAGTGQGISTYIHVANSYADRAEDGRRSNCRHSANSLWERVDSCMQWGPVLSSQMLEVTSGHMANNLNFKIPLTRRGRVSKWRSEGFNQGWKLIRIKNRTARAYSKRGRHSTHRTHWSLHQLGFLPRVNEADSYSKERPNWQGTDCAEPSPG